VESVEAASCRVALVPGVGIDRADAVTEVNFVTERGAVEAAALGKSLPWGRQDSNLDLTDMSRPGPTPLRSSPSTPPLQQDHFSSGLDTESLSG
jgi:hypothetical protein